MGHRNQLLLSYSDSWMIFYFCLNCNLCPLWYSYLRLKSQKKELETSAHYNGHGLNHSFSQTTRFGNIDMNPLNMISQVYSIFFLRWDCWLVQKVKSSNWKLKHQNSTELTGSFSWDLWGKKGIKRKYYFRCSFMKCSHMENLIFNKKNFNFKW